MINNEITELIERYPKLKTCNKDISDAFNLMYKAYKNNKKILIAGNGGSAADAEHISGELMKCFKNRKHINKNLQSKLIKIDKKIGNELSKNLQSPIEAIPLTSHVSLTTAYMNDVNAKGVFAQQLLGYGKKGDIFLAISTSGNSKNIIYACVLAKAMGIKVIGLTGNNKSRLMELSDVCIQVPEKETHKIQELHLPIYHCLCLMLENRI